MHEWSSMTGAGSFCLARKGAAHVALVIGLFERFALIIQVLAAGNAQFNLGPALLEIHS